LTQFITSKHALRNFLQLESWYFGIWWGKTPLSSFTCRKKLKTNIKYQVSTLLLSVRRSYACGKMLLEIYERLLSELNWRWLGNGWNWMGMEKCTSSLATDFSGRPCARLVSIWSDHLAFLHHLPCNRLAYELVAGGIHDLTFPSVPMQMQCQFGSCQLRWLARWEDFRL